MYRWAWILLFCLSTIHGCQKTDRSTELAQDPSIQVYFNHRDTGKQTYTEPYRPIKRGGDNLEAIIIDEIRSANSTIDLAVQELNLPLVAQALVKSHRSGVRVRVILDNNYSRALSSLTHSEINGLKKRDRLKYEEFLALVDLNSDNRLDQIEIAQRDALFMLHQAGITMIDDTADGSKGSGLMHHKFMVVDDRTVITGSANFTLSGIFGDFSNFDTRGNTNYLLRIARPQIAHLFTEEFEYMWGNRRINSKFGLDKQARSPVTVSWDNTTITLQFSPTSTSKDWHLSTNGSIGAAISDAKQSVNLALFVFSDQTIANILQQKQQQGIEINGIFDRGFAFRYYSEVLDLLGVTGYYRCRVEANNNPWTKPLDTIGVANLDSGDKLHHKFALIDRQTAIAGSQNWSAAANNLNDETLLMINNQTVAQHFEREFQRLSDSTNWGLPLGVNSKLQKQRQNCQSKNQFNLLTEYINYSL